VISTSLIENFTLAKATVFGTVVCIEIARKTLPISRAQPKDFGHTRERDRQFQALPMARVGRYASPISFATPGEDHESIDF
jgi:hypothetical protein